MSAGRWWDGQSRYVVSLRIGRDPGHGHPITFLRLSCGCEQMNTPKNRPKVGGAEICTNRDCPGVGQ